MFFYLKIFSALDYSLSDEGLKEICSRTIRLARLNYCAARVYRLTYVSLLLLILSFFSFIFIGDLAEIFVNFLV